MRHPAGDRAVIDSAIYAVRKNLETHGVADPGEVLKNPGYWERREAAVRDWMDSRPGASIRGMIAEAGLGGIAPAVNTDDPYMEVLRRDAGYHGFAPGELEAHAREMAKTRADHTAYEREIWRLFDAASQLELERRAAEEAGDLERLELVGSGTYAVLKALETYGVPSSTRELQKSHAYWEHLAAEVRGEINGRSGPG